MIRKKPIFNLSKIQGTTKRKPKDDYIEIMYDDFDPMIKELQKKLKKPIGESLKNYFIIRLVTWLEFELKEIIIDLIDTHNLEINTLFTTGEITIPLNDFKILKNKKITEGRIIATNFNFQNPEEINFVFSRLLQLDFFKTMQELMIHPKYSKEKDFKKYFLAMNKNWNNLMELFEIRNHIIHTTNSTNNLRKNYKYYGTMYDVVCYFLVICETLPSLIVSHNNGKLNNLVLTKFFNTKHKEYKKV